MLRVFERAFNARKANDLRDSFIPQFVNDVGVPLPRILLWSCFCSVLLALAFGLDGPVGQWLTLSGPNGLTRLVGLISKAGEGWVIAVFGIVGVSFQFWRWRFEAGAGVFLVALTGLMTGAAATVVRSLLGRTRPSSHELQGFYGIWHSSHWIVGKYEFGSFPSGHAATVIGVAAATWLINRRFGLVAWIYALMVSWSRVALGCHHFSDIVAAAILGVAGAHVIVAHFGPTIFSLGDALQKAWAVRQGSGPRQVTG